MALKNKVKKKYRRRLVPKCVFKRLVAVGKTCWGTYDQAQPEAGAEANRGGAESRIRSRDGGRLWAHAVEANATPMTSD